MVRLRLLNRVAVRCFSYFGLAYYSQGIIAALQSASGDVARTVAGETNLSSTLAQSAILAGLLLAVAREPGRYARLSKPLVPVLCIAGFALLSVLWSADPVRTLRRATALSECLLFGIFLYRTDGFERTVRRVGQVCVVMAALSLVAYVAVPSIGRETALGYEHAMRGVFPQKNSMSECMLLGLCCYAYQMLERLHWRHVVAVAVLLLCMVVGRAASVLAVTGVVVLVAFWFKLQGKPVWRLGLLFLTGWAATALLAGLIVFPHELFALAGRDTSLTGRVPLWEAIWPEILRAPLIGHSYAGFWNMESPTIQMIWRTIGWEAPDAHSSYLDILLQLGVIGLAFYVWTWVVLFRRASASNGTGLASSRFTILYGVALLLIGLDEGVIPIPNAWTTLLPVSLIAMSRHLALRRAERPVSSSHFPGLQLYPE
jgi:O-antigen ligase